MKKLVNKIGQKIYSNKYVIAASIFITNVLMPEIVRAEVKGSYVKPINGLKTVLMVIAGATGGVFLVYGGIKFAISYTKQDQNGEHAAINWVIAGGVLIGIDVVVAALS